MSRRPPPRHRDRPHGSAPRQDAGGPRRPGPGRPRGAGRAHALERGDPGTLYGLNAVEAALHARRRTLRALLLKAGALSGRLAQLEALAHEVGLPVEQHPPAELEGFCHSPNHQGAVLRCGPLPVLDEHAALALGDWRADAAPPDAAPPLLVALDQVEDPRNLGAVVRSVAAFGAAGIVVPRDHSAPLSAAASSASAGTLEHVPVHAVPNLARFLEQAKGHGFWVVGTTAEGGEPLSGYTHDRPLVLVLGSEGRGLRPLVARSCDQHLTIPLAGGAHDGPGSLNVASAAAVLLYHLMTYR